MRSVAVVAFVSWVFGTSIAAAGGGLTPAERRALSLSEKAASSGGVLPVAGEDGALVYPFGHGLPTLICAPLQVCDLALEAGETVIGINCGDSRWNVAQTYSGSVAGDVPHIIVKPLTDLEASTTLVVNTDRRTYRLRLKIRPNQSMPFVRFSYPQDLSQVFAAREREVRQERARMTDKQTGEYLGELDFDYTVSGDRVPWRPTRVYNDGKKTVIELPDKVRGRRAPVLVIVRREKGFLSVFKKDQEHQTNSSYKDGRIVVDELFERARLLSGVGKDQRRVDIRWRNP